MVVSNVLPRRPRHLHVFAASLLVLLVTLMIFLFAVSMEATVSAPGLVTSGGIVIVRGTQGGTWEPGPEVLAGKIVTASAIIGHVRSGRATIDIQVPDSRKRWLILDTPSTAGQKVQAGDMLLSLVPLEDEGERIADWQVRLDIDEKSFGDIRAGQEVRLQSNMHTYRAYVPAAGKIDRLEPRGESGPNGTRIFHAWVRVEQSPFPLWIGGSVKAEVIVGRKQTYQIILEH